jgi:hypothetical protein
MVALRTLRQRLSSQKFRQIKRKESLKNRRNRASKPTKVPKIISPICKLVRKQSARELSIPNQIKIWMMVKGCRFMETQSLVEPLIIVRSLVNSDQNLKQLNFRQSHLKCRS